MKKIALIIILSIFMAINLVVVKAEVRIITAENAKVDKSSTREDTNYNLQNKIVVVPIFPRSNDLEVTSEEHYRGIYYYTVDVLGFNDIPFHYLLGEDGKVYEGNQGGDERRVLVDGIGSDIITVGYMTNKSAAGFTSQSTASLVNLLSDIANRNAISPQNISIEGITFLRDETAKSVSISKANLFGNWNTDLSKIIEQVNAKYNPIPKTYKVSIEEVITPAQEIEPGSEAEITVKIANLSTNGIYAGTDSEILFSKADGNFSNFFLNNEWVSITQVSPMSSGEILLPFDETSLTFKVKAPLYIGEISETFKVTNILGSQIETEPFEIKLNMKNSDKKIIEINNTETGALNVRTSPSSVGEVLSQVSPGERFFTTEDAGNGWIKILLSDGQEGWVASWLVSFIN